MSRSSLHKKIKALTGLTPNDYIKLIRLNKAAELLSSGSYKVNEVCYLVGFNTPSYLRSVFINSSTSCPVRNWTDCAGGLTAVLCIVQ